MDMSSLPARPEDIRDELARVLASPEFDASHRNRRFLSYVVEETLAGRGDRIKAYAIATSVFGRDQNFDSQLDSIVRIEAGRLRRSLEHYYLTAGVRNAIRIAVPRGTYVPTFTRVDDDPVAPAAPAGHTPPATGNRAGRGLPVIFVLDFTDDSLVPVPHLASGVTRQVVLGLTRFGHLVVYGPQSTQAKAADGDLARLRAEFGVDFVLSGGLAQSGGALSVDALLVDARTGRYVWAERCDRRCDAEGVIPARDDAVDCIVRQLAQPWGVIYSIFATEVDDAPLSEMTTFDALVRFQKYIATYDPALYPRTRAVLEHVVQRDPDCGEAWAALSRLHLDGLRFGIRLDGDPPPQGMIAKAVDHARRAIALAPTSSHSFLALGQAHWFRGNLDGAFQALDTALSLNPNDTETMAELGLRECLRMNWESGARRIEEAYARNPALPPNHRVGLSLWHFAHGRMREARDEAVRMSVPAMLYRHVMLAVTGQALGETEEMQAAVQALLRHDPAYGAHAAQDLALRSVHPELVAMLVDGLRAAGLTEPPRSAVGME